MSDAVTAEINAQNHQGPMPDMPDTQVSARDVFGIDTDMQVPAFSDASQYVPDLDTDYLFDKDTTICLLYTSPSPRD